MKRLLYARHRGKCFQMWFPLILPTTLTRRFYCCFPDFVDEGTGVGERKQSICLRNEPGQMIRSLSSYPPHSAPSSVWPWTWILRPLMTQHCWPHRGASSMSGVPPFFTDLSSDLIPLCTWLILILIQTCVAKRNMPAILDPLLFILGVLFHRMGHSVEPRITWTGIPYFLNIL